MSIQDSIRSDSFYIDHPELSWSQVRKPNIVISTSLEPDKVDWSKKGDKDTLDDSIQTELIHSPSKRSGQTTLLRDGSLTDYQGTFRQDAPTNDQLFGGSNTKQTGKHHELSEVIDLDEEQEQSEEEHGIISEEDDDEEEEKSEVYELVICPKPKKGGMVKGSKQCVKLQETPESSSYKGRQKKPRYETQNSNKIDGIDIGTYESISEKFKFTDSFSLFSHCCGAIFGALLGDAIGSYLEFKPPQSPRVIEEAMQIKGGGPFDLSPGQCTDDGELTMALLNGLATMPDGKFELDQIARFYGEWIDSSPFDIGRTISKSFSAISKGIHKKMYRGLANRARRKAHLENKPSQSNGGLMRITPLAVFCLRLSEDEIDAVAKMETSLTHPNKLAQIASSCYVKTLVYLIKNQEEDRMNAYYYGKRVAKGTELEEIFDDIEHGIEPQTTVKPGWLRTAFYYSYKYLKEGYTYYEAIKKVISLGGDTDTNACIVGGMIGAAVGYESLPSSLLWKLNSWKGTDYKVERPKFVEPSSAYKIISALLERAPRMLETEHSIDSHLTFSV